jgi:hypothetical protein
MSFWGRFQKTWAGLFAKSERPDALPALDVASLTEHFNINAEAKRMALLGLPAFHSKTLTQLEQEMFRYIDRGREQIQRQATHELEKLDNLIADVHAQQHSMQSAKTTADFERQALVVFNEQSAWLEKLGTKANRRTNELERFRKNNDLDRDAIYPEGSGVFMRYAFLLLLIVFEGLFNAHFFAEGLTTGLLGGFSYAATLAALNVVVMFLMGKSLLRWLFHVRAPYKMVGLLGLGLSLLYSVCVALAIAHLRTAILGGSADPTKDAWVTLTSQTLALNDLLSWALFLVTIGFGLASMLDGLFMDDLYPGYGDVTRREKLAVEEFEDEFEEVRQDLEDLKQESLDALDEEVRKATQLVARCKQLIDDKKLLHKSWMKALDESEVALYAVLRIFRAENERHRHDGMRPAYFDTIPRLNAVALPHPHTDQLEASYAELAAKAKAMEDSLSERKGFVYELFDKHIQQLNFIKQKPASHT